MFDSAETIFSSYGVLIFLTRLKSLDDKAKAVRIAGHFKAGDLETLLATLRDSFEISYKQVSGSRVKLGSQ